MAFCFAVAVPFVLIVLEQDPRSLVVLSKHSLTESHSQSVSEFLSLRKHTMAKNKLGRTGIVSFRNPGNHPSLGEVRIGTQAG